MATIVRVPGDPRAGLLGQAIGAFAGNVLEARKRAEDEKKRKEALARASDLIANVSRGIGTADESDVADALSGVVDPEDILDIVQATSRARLAKRQKEEDVIRDRAKEERGAIRGRSKERRVEARAIGAEQRGEKRAQRAATTLSQRRIAAAETTDVRKKEAETRAFSREDKLLAEALERADVEEAETRVQEKLTLLGLNRVLRGSGDATPQQLTSRIVRASQDGDFSVDQIFSLLDRVDDLAGKPDEEGVVKQSIFGIPGGRKAEFRFPPEIANADVATKDAYLASKGIKATVQAIPLQTGEERVLETLTRNAGGEEDPHLKKIIALKKLGLVDIKATPTGDTIITDLAKGTSVFIPNPVMDATAVRNVQFRISAIEDTLTALEKIDVTKVGLDDFLSAKVGGFIFGGPGVLRVLAGSVLDWLGLEPSEVAEAQAARGSFFEVIAPLAASIANEEGSRNAISSPVAIELAKDMVLITNPTTTPMAASIAVARLKVFLSDLKIELEIQLQHKSNLRPQIIRTDLKENEDGTVRIEKRE